MWRDRGRGQSIQIGAVLLFGALILALSGYQAFVVPQQNEQVEFSHSQTVQDHLSDLRNAVVSVPGDTASQSVSIHLGTRYPSRIIAVNPGPPTGSLRTSATGDSSVTMSVSNAAADGETGDVWDGTQRSFNTGWLSYRANYNVYGGAPTTFYGASVLYNEFPSGTVPLSDQTLVDGTQVSLVALNGSLGVTRTGAASVDVRPVSASTRTVAVENDTATSNVTIRVPTRLSLSTWEELLAGETIDEGGHVVGDKLRMEALAGYPDAQVLVVELERGVTYDLRLAKAGVGRRVTDTSETYATDVAGNDTAVPEEGSQLLVVEVRDGFNNPVSGVEVTGSAEGGTLASRTATTGADGRASFLYEAPTVTAEEELAVNFSYQIDPATVANFDPTTPENADVTVRVQNTQVDGGTGDGGPSEYDLAWKSPDVSEGGTHLSNCDGDDCTWDVGADPNNKLDLAAATDPAVEDATVDFALNNSTVGTLSSSEAVTDANGEVTTTLTAKENGTVRLYAVSGGASDVINVTVENVTTSPVTVDFRVDDISHTDTDDNRFVASYDATGNSEAASVRVTFDNGNNPQTMTDNSAPLRGNQTYQVSTGNDDYDITVEVLDSSGTVLTSETITDTADGVTPSAQNEGISSPTVLDSYDIEDKSSGGNPVRYRLNSYQVSGADFSKIKFVAIPPDDGDTTDDIAETNNPAATDGNIDINGDFYDGGTYRVGIIVFGDEGAVVDRAFHDDAPDGSGRFTASVLPFVALALLLGYLRRAVRRNDD